MASTVSYFFSFFLSLRRAHFSWLQFIDEKRLSTLLLICPKQVINFWPKEPAPRRTFSIFDGWFIFDDGFLTLLGMKTDSEE